MGGGLFFGVRKKITQGDLVEVIQSMGRALALCRHLLLEIAVDLFKQMRGLWELQDLCQHANAWSMGLFEDLLCEVLYLF